MSDKSEATFRINVDGNAAASMKSVSASSRQAAKSISDYETEVKALSGDLRRLRGNSDDVVAAKKALKAKIDEAKTSASSLTVELIKQGVSYKAAAEAAKKYGNAQKVLPNLRGGIAKVGVAIGTALGGVGRGAQKKLAPATKKLGDLFAPVSKAIGAKLAPVGAKLTKWGGAAAKAFGKVGTAAKEDLGSVVSTVGPLLGKVLAGSVAIAAAAAAAAAVAFVAAGAALAAFGLGTADVAAKMNRQREALLGTAKDAGNLGDHITALAGTVPQSVAELNQLALSLSKTRISGKATVAALNAISQVTGAVDAAAGSKIEELITRGDKFGRMSIGMFELDGTGLDFDDVAKAYSEGTKKSIDAARKELRMGIAPIDAGADALRKAAEKKFGALNIKNAFSLENAPKKFKEQLQALSKDVDLGPISDALKDAFGQLAPNAPLGSAVKEFMTVFGGGIVDVGAKAIPVLLEGFKWMVVWGLKIATVFVETRNAITKAFSEGDWFGIGKAIIVGLWKGIFSNIDTLERGVWDVAKKIKDAFTGPKGIDSHSPSKVFERYGEYTTEGYAQGVERGSKRASGAVQDMVDAPSAPGIGGAGGGPISVSVVIHGAPTGDAKAMQGPEFEAMLSRSIRNALSARGLVPA